MFKRITGFTLALLMVLISLIGAIPANADFKDGDIVTISKSAGGGVYYNYNADQKYNVSAMNVTMEGSNATYFAWCASYGVSVPQAGRRYILCNTDNAGTVTVDGGEWPLFYAVPSEGIYWYYDTGLGDYIDFSWALSCIKAAEYLASTTELPFSWRMAVELAIRSQLQGMFGNYGLDLNVEVADNNLFGYAISSYFTEPDCNTVAEFMDRAKDIATHADDNPVFWEPYAEEIEAVEERRNFYRGDDFILFEGHLNKSNCEYTVYDTYPDVEVELNGGMLTVSIPKSKIPIGVRIYWNVDLHLDAGDNYNMLYGKPENGGTDVQNIMVYSVNKSDLEKTFKGDYITTEEKATVTVQKTNESGKALSGMKFELYEVESDNALTMVRSFSTNSNGLYNTEPLDLGDYFLVENCEGTGYEPHKPEEWNIDGATNAVYTTIGGKQGWKLLLGPGTTNATVSAVNKETLKNLNIVKTNTEGNCMPGFKFTLYPILPNGSLGTGTTKETRSNGYVFFTDLKLGDYFVVENYEDTGYEPDKPENWYVVADKAEYTTIGGKQGWKITLSKNNASIEAVNKKTVKDLNIVKTDTEGNSMPGFKFTVYPILPNGSLGTGITKETRSDGYVFFTALELGSYFVVENYEGTGYVPHKPEDWYVSDDKAEYTTISGKQGWKITLSNQNVHIEAVNKPQTVLRVEKSNKDHSDPKGFKFTLYPVNADGSLGAGTQKAADVFGVLLFADLDLGTYFLVENYEGTGYAPYKQEDWQIDHAVSSEFTTIEGMQGWKLELGKTYAWVFADNYKVDHHITVEKVDTEGKPVPGVSFNVYPVINGALGTATVIVTDANGTATLTFEKPGEFFVAEVAPVGQLPHNPDQWEVSSAKSATFKTINGIAGWHITLDQDYTYATLKAVNADQTGAIEINKYGEGGLGDNDVFKFEITSDNDPAFSETITLSTDVENGVASGSLSNLPIFKADGSFITYTITEIEAPSRFIKAEPQTITFEEKYKADSLAIAYTVTVDFYNLQQKFNVAVKKDSEDGVKAGFVFEISNGNGKKWSATTNADGVAIFYKNGSATETVELPAYDVNNNAIVYTLTEAVTEIYVPFTPVTFTVNDVDDSNTFTVNAKNTIKRGSLAFNKISHTGEKLAGAEFLLEVSKDNGATWQRATADDCSSEGLKDGVLVSDAKNDLVFSGLLMDNKTRFRVTEIKAPEGFLRHVDPVFEGLLTEEVEKKGMTTVKNTPTPPPPPDTGDSGFWIVTLGVMMACVGMMGLLLSTRKKRSTI